MEASQVFEATKPPVDEATLRALGGGIDPNYIPEPADIEGCDPYAPFMQHDTSFVS